MVDANTKGWALVTGAAGGIGRALAFEFADRGYSVFALDRRDEDLDRLGKELGARHPSLAYSALAINLAVTDAAERVHAEAHKRGLQIELLVNNVGFGKMGEHVLQSPEIMTDMLALNNLLMTKLCILFGREMKARASGRILNVASLVGLSSSPFFGAYSGTKAYVIAFSVALARELGDYGVTVSCLCPGTTATNFLDSAEIDDASSRGMRRFVSAFIATPEIVAAAGASGLDRGKLVIVPTAFLRVQAFFLRIMPVEITTAFVHRKIVKANRAECLTRN